MGWDKSRNLKIITKVNWTEHFTSIIQEQFRGHVTLQSGMSPCCSNTFLAKYRWLKIKIWILHRCMDMLLCKARLQKRNWWSHQCRIWTLCNALQKAVLAPRLPKTRHWKALWTGTSHASFHTRVPRLSRMSKMCQTISARLYFWSDNSSVKHWEYF